MSSAKTTPTKQGFTLVEAVVGTALVAIVFTGIFGAYRLGLRVVGLSKNKITATAIANSQIEKIRNLPYASVGVQGAALPSALGVIDAIATQTSNGVVFTVATDVEFIVDPADGTGAADNCNWDYKKVDVTVSWHDNFPGRVDLSTNIAPESQVQETQTCLSQPGGVLAATVFDSTGALVYSPLIQIFKMPDNTLADSATPANGTHSFPLAAGIYRIVVSRDDYNSTRTYDSNEIAAPNDPDPAVINGNATQKSLSIDRLATMSIDGIAPSGLGNFGDSFADQSKISEINGAQVLAGSVQLAGPPYPMNGYALSSEIAPTDLVSWHQLSFADNRPASTGILYQILFYDGSNWGLVPDQDLGNNSTGLAVSPIQLGGLSVATYPRLKIKANLSSNDSMATPQVNAWQATWVSSGGAAVSGVAFHLQGQKTIGKDAGGQDVFKYAQDLSLDAGGHKELADIESDNYTFSVNPAGGFSLAGIDPSPQPVNATPGAAVAVKLYLVAQNALLITAQDGQTLEPVFSATVHLASVPPGYDKTQYTNQKGQTYFAPLVNGNYSLIIQAPGYVDYSGSVAVSNQVVSLVNLNKIQ